MKDSAVPGTLTPSNFTKRAGAVSGHYKEPGRLQIPERYMRGALWSKIQMKKTLYIMVFPSPVLFIYVKDIHTLTLEQF